MRLSLPLIAAGLFLVASSSQAQQIDQNQPLWTTGQFMAGFGQTDLGQSFQQTAGNIDGAGILLCTNVNGYCTGSGNITISLWDNTPGNGGNQLATGTAFGNSGSWVDVFWSDFGVTPATTYYLVFTSDNELMGIQGDLYDPYPYGHVYANDWNSSDWPNYDYTFRTYEDPNYNVTPEPATMVLLGTGLLGIGGIVRRRRKSIES